MENSRVNKYLNYFSQLVQQPTGGWEGFLITPAEGMNFGLRFQLAFPVYALYSIANYLPEQKDQCVWAIGRYLEKMLHPDTWAYWFRGAVASQQPEKVKSGLMQGTVEKVHNKLGMGNTPISPDPCQQGNIQYSGHLASMLGFYQLLSGDDRYNREGFGLTTELDGERFRFEYTYSQLAKHIQAQMSENYFGGVCCEPGRAYAACNNHACISNILHDRLYQTELANANGAWGSWVENKMLSDSGLLPLPAPNGLLSVAYMTELKMPLPVSFNFTDAWGFAFMAGWYPKLVQKIYPRFRKRLKAVGANKLKLGSLGINERMQISSEALNTAFALVLAREMGDVETAANLLRYLDEVYQPTEENNLRYYRAGVPAPYVTALIALSESLPVEGKGLYRLLNA